jgi:hypothetical protein
MLGELRPHHARGGGLERGRQMVAVRGAQPVGVAAFEMEEALLTVHALVIADPVEQVLPAIIAALELACLAAGGTHLSISTHADAPLEALQALGYDADAARRAWLTRCLT